MIAPEENYKWFQDNLPSLVKDYKEQYVVIKDKAIIGSYRTFDDAFRITLTKEPPGTFIVQLCTLDESKVMRVFHSRVKFC
jgi:hypothetical protein